MMEKQTIRRPKLDGFNKINKREKNYEDDLLRKIQAEYMPVVEEEKITQPEIVRDENRTHYEQQLLDRLMTDIQRRSESDRPRYDKKIKAETLMITSAVALSDEEKERLVRKFIEKTNRPLRRITSVVDPNLITGLRLQSETFYYEVSGQKQLREMRAFLEKSWLQGDEKA